MCGLDDKMREEKRNKRDAVKRENRMGCCCNDTHSLIWIYRQLYFIVCIYIRGIKSSGLRFMVYFESISSACKDFGWQLYLIGCIYRSRIKSSDAKGMSWWGGRSFLLFTAKIISDASWWGGYKPPHRIYKWRDSCDTRRYETGLFEHKNALYLG